MSRLSYQIPNFTYPDTAPADIFPTVVAQAKAAEDAAWQRQREQLDDLRERAAEIDRQRAQRKSSK